MANACCLLGDAQHLKSKSTKFGYPSGILGSRISDLFSPTVSLQFLLSQVRSDLFAIFLHLSLPSEKRGFSLWVMKSRSGTKLVAAAAAAVFLVLFLSISHTSAQESVLKDELEGLSGSSSSNALGRRGMQIATDAFNSDSASFTRNLDSGLGLFDALFASLSMIIVSEIGDETFIIAALMAMRHPKSIVLSGALAALVVMTVLSTGLGRIVPNLISRKYTNSAATVLYAFFGLRLLYIAWKSNSKSSQKKEMEEVEEKLEAGQGKTIFRRFFSRFCTPIFLESFILTFLAEWGDRSQIATIALATHKNAIGVALGAVLGHTICTSLAVVGGSMLASKISQGTVATIGGLLFLCFSLSSYFYPPL